MFFEKLVLAKTFDQEKNDFCKLLLKFFFDCQNKNKNYLEF